MTASQLMDDLDQRGIRLEVRGDRLRYSPRSAVTPELTERMIQCKPELLKIIRGDGGTSLECCWCGSTRLIDGLSGRVWCDDCERPAWLPIPEGIVRANQTSEYIEPPDPCDQCGTLELWQTLIGNWRCLHCEPPTRARLLREQAEQLRQWSIRAAQIQRNRLSVNGIAANNIEPKRGG
jgi:TubC N-terminal docking domain